MRHEHVGKEICAAFNEDTLTLVDVTNAANQIQLSKAGYSGSRYTHQGWFDEQHAYIYANDELDEGNSDPKTRTLIFNCDDLDNPEFVIFSSTTLMQSTTMATCTTGTCTNPTIVLVRRSSRSGQTMNSLRLHISM